MAKTKKYTVHVRALAGELDCIRDAEGNEGFLMDLALLRLKHTQLKKLQNDELVYPQAPPKVYNARSEGIWAAKKVIMEVCKERGIGWEFYNTGSWEQRRLDMVCRFTRKGTILNALLDF